MAVSLLMGYCVNKHLYTIEDVSDPTCRDCFENEADFLSKCPTQVSPRLRYLRAQFLKPEKVKKFRINQYVKVRRRDRADGVNQIWCT